MSATAMGSMKPETHKTPDIERDLVSACSGVPKALVWQQQILPMGKGKRSDADVDPRIAYIPHRACAVIPVAVSKESYARQSRAEQGKAAKEEQEEACLQEQTSCLYACMQGY
ncbi:unnamed protein product [Fusarium venenatum]|uniref:Uncharacterized protein n=1 Tax=Fusarium venenatum TaxID=56646 RepID=A0A2L2T3N7_9HYPO|nr:uncharacterized protein FVRRES_00880 [Fusarium venenatum]CEI64368.1 unnamed protein product [Fusarium venenatum]